MKKLILISALLFSFNGWTDEIYLECEREGSANNDSAWINQSCKITKKIKHYYEIKEGSWRVTNRLKTTDSIPGINPETGGNQLCGDKAEPFDVLIARAKETGKAIYWTKRISRENFLMEFGSDLMEDFPSQAAVIYSDREIKLNWVTGKLLKKPNWEVSLYASMDRLTGVVKIPYGSDEYCSAISKKDYMKVVGNWDQKVNEILKAEKDFLNKNKKF